MSKHDTLKSQWQPGQRWETLVEGCEQWVPVAEGGFAQPLWDERQDYRLAASSGEQVSAAAGLKGTHPMRDGYTGSVLDSAPNGHKLTAYYATREQADAAQAWLADGVAACDEPQPVGWLDSFGELHKRREDAWDGDPDSTPPRPVYAAGVKGGS